MAQRISLPRHSSERGNLTVFERVLPGLPRRVFYITNADGFTRGGHRHHRAWQALICLQGQVDVLVETRESTTRYTLTDPAECLVLEPGDWHMLEHFRHSAIVLVVSNEHYDEQDYIHECYAPADQQRNVTAPIMP